MADAFDPVPGIDTGNADPPKDAPSDDPQEDTKLHIDEDGQSSLEEPA